MPLLTLSQAAKECGKSKSVLLEAIRSGRLSANRNDLNQWQIDPAELFRVYPVERSENGQKEQNETPVERHQNALLQAQVSYLEKQLATVEAVADDLRKDRDQWRQQATALLTHQPQPEAKPTEPKAEPEPLGAFWVSIISIVATLSALAIGVALTFHWWQ